MRDMEGFCTGFETLAGWVEGKKNGKIDESGRRHSDIVPACRYGVLAATPFLPVDAPEPTREERTRQGEAEAAKKRRRYAEGLARRSPGDSGGLDGDEWADDTPGLGIDD